MATAYHITLSPPAQEEYWNCVCIPLTKGYHTVIDIADYDLVVRYKWYVAISRHGNPYAMHKVITDHGKHRNKALHSLLVEGLVDHRDRDSLNNRRSNLRPCTRAENSRNCKRSNLKKTSKYHGVCWNKAKKKWIAQIHLNNTSIHIGHFTDEVAAAYAFNEAAKKYHGQFASLNILP